MLCTLSIQLISLVHRQTYILHKFVTFINNDSELSVLKILNSAYATLPLLT